MSNFETFFLFQLKCSKVYNCNKWNISNKIIIFLMIYYTFGQLKRRFNISVFGIAEYQNITKEIYRSQRRRLPKDIQRRRPQESAFRMSKGVKHVKETVLKPVKEKVDLCFWSSNLVIKFGHQIWWPNVPVKTTKFGKVFSMRFICCLKSWTSCFSYGIFTSVRMRTF